VVKVNGKLKKEVNKWMVPLLTGGKKKLIKYKVMAYSSKKPAVKKSGYTKSGVKIEAPLMLKKCGSSRYGKNK